MTWGKKPAAERPEWPKLVPIPGTAEEAAELVPLLRHEDPEAEIVEGGGHGVFSRCFNEKSELAAKLYSEKRPIPKA